jgi:hypothetical protein
MAARRAGAGEGKAMTKLDTLKAAAAAGDWQRAVAIAARFPRLGAHRNAVLDAHSAYTNPRFLVQVGRDVDACIAAGKSALIAAYGIEAVKN